MKKIFFLIASAFSFGALLVSCSTESNDTHKKDAVSAQSYEGKELWAEQVEAQTDITKPDSWSDNDWKSIVKGVNREEIFNTIMEEVLSGRRKAYNYLLDSTEFSIDEVKSMLYADTIGPNDIAHIRVKEQWYFDKEKFKLEKKVNSIGLFINSYADDGTVRGFTPLFYVNLSN